VCIHAHTEIGFSPRNATKSLSFVLKRAKTFEEDLIQFLLAEDSFRYRIVKKKIHSYVIQKYISEVFPPIPLGTCSHA